MKTSEFIKLKQQEIEHNQWLINFCATLPPDLNLPNLVIYEGCLDIDNATHEQRIALMLLLGVGKWDKEPGGVEGTINYIGKLPDGKRIRFWSSAPLPSCKLVEEMVLVAAQPEHYIKRMKLVCPGTEEASSNPKPIEEVSA